MPEQDCNLDEIDHVASLGEGISDISALLDLTEVPSSVELFDPMRKGDDVSSTPQTFTDLRHTPAGPPTLSEQAYREGRACTALVDLTNALDLLLAQMSEILGKAKRLLGLEGDQQ